MFVLVLGNNNSIFDFIFFVVYEIRFGLKRSLKKETRVWQEKGFNITVAGGGDGEESQDWTSACLGEQNIFLGLLT